MTSQVIALGLTPDTGTITNYFAQVCAGSDARSVEAARSRLRDRQRRDGFMSAQRRDEFMSALEANRNRPDAR